MKTLLTPPEASTGTNARSNSKEETSLISSKQWKLIDAIDFSMIKAKLCHKKGEGWTQAEAKYYINKYKKWLYLRLVAPDATHVPSEKIDEVWHAHILDTKAYAADCNRIFGNMLHHFPYLGLRGKEDEDNLKRAYVSTQDLFRKVWSEEMSPDISSMCNGGSDAGGTCHMIDEGKK